MCIQYLGEKLSRSQRGGRTTAMLPDLRPDLPARPPASSSVAVTFSSNPLLASLLRLSACPSPSSRVHVRLICPYDAVVLHGKKITRKEEQRKEEKRRERRTKNNRRRTHCPVVPSRVAVAARVCQVRSRPACYCTLRKKDNRKKKSEKKRRVETRTKNIRRLAH